MVNYYDIMRRGHPGQAPLWKSDLAQEETVIEPDAEASKALAPIAILSQARTPFEAARTRSLQALNERLAPLAGVGQSVRLLVTGCRPGDGASTVAMGLALDLSQRLGLRTLLVDAHLRKPELHKMFPPAGAKSPPLLLGDQFVVRPSSVPRLELASCLPMTAGAMRPGDAQSYEALLDSFLRGDRGPGRGASGWAPVGSGAADRSDRGGDPLRVHRTRRTGDHRGRA